MANVFSLNVATNLGAQLTGGPAYPALAAPSSLNPADSGYTAGTATGSIDQLYMSLVSATTSGASIQLNGSSLLDPIGGAFAPLRLTSIGIFNSGSATVTVNGAFITSAFGASAAFPIHASGRAVLDFPSATGIAVPSGTNSVITFTAASGTQAMRVLLAGRSV